MRAQAHTRETCVCTCTMLLNYHKYYPELPSGVFVDLHVVFVHICFVPPAHITKKKKTHYEYNSELPVARRASASIPRCQDEFCGTNVRSVFFLKKVAVRVCAVEERATWVERFLVREGWGRERATEKNKQNRCSRNSDGMKTGRGSAADMCIMT